MKPVHNQKFRNCNIPTKSARKEKKDNILLHQWAGG
jgi:hypothetical protein